jgi:predicted RND superfamily exporter protein
MMLYVYAAIMILVLLAYRDWRAMLACCLPLTWRPSSATGS